MNMKLISCHLDKLVMTYYFSANDVIQGFQSKLVQVAKLFADRNCINEKQILHPQQHYSMMIKLPLFSEVNHRGSNTEVPMLIVHALPFSSSSKRPDVKFTVTGHPFGKAKWYCVRLWLELLLGPTEYKLFYANATINAFDIACDVENRLSDFLIDRPYATKSAVYMNGEMESESFYLGDIGSAFCFCYYSRIAKAQKFNITLKSCAQTRYEFRHTRRKLTLAEFTQTTVALEKLDSVVFYDVETLMADARFTADFIEVCQTKGLKNRLLRESKSDRRRLRKMLSVARTGNDLRQMSIPLWEKQQKYLKVLEPDFNQNQSKAIEVSSLFHQTYLKRM